MHYKPKKRTSVVLDFLKAIRRRYPKAQRIYVVMDNLSTHKTPRSCGGADETRSRRSSPIRPTRHG